MIRLEHVTRVYPNREGLRDVSLEVKQGEVVALIGPSGAGKSTLLRTINLLEKPDSGKVMMEEQDLMDPGTDIYRVRQRIGMVFQGFTLFSHKTILENVMMGPMDLLGKSREQARQDGIRYLEQVGLGEKLDAYPDELSGGQQQRGEIARCLAMEPKILLLDEVTALLDASMKAEVQAVLRRLIAQGTTILMVTNDLEFCRQAATRVCFMEHGRIIEEGTPGEIFDSPKEESTRAFVKQMKTLSYEIYSRKFDLYDLNSQIENFGRDYFLSEKNIRDLELIIEELIFQNLLAHTERIGLQIHYAQAEKRINIALRYEGERFDPFENEEEDILSMLIIVQLTENVQYRFEDANYLTFDMTV